MTSKNDWLYQQRRDFPRHKKRNNAVDLRKAEFTGEAAASAVVDTLVQWEAVTAVLGLCFDTTVVGTGQHTAAPVLSHSNTKLNFTVCCWHASITCRSAASTHLCNVYGCSNGAGRVAGLPYYLTKPCAVNEKTGVSRPVASLVCLGGQEKFKGGRRRPASGRRPRE